TPLRKAFERAWPEFKNKLDEVLSEPSTVTSPKKRSVEDMLEEILTIVRGYSTALSDGKIVIQVPHGAARTAIIDLLRGHLASNFEDLRRRLLADTLQSMPVPRPPNDEK